MTKGILKERVHLSGQQMELHVLFIYIFFSASVWALHRSTVVELVSGQILTLTFCSGLQLGF